MKRISSNRHRLVTYASGTLACIVSIAGIITRAEDLIWPAMSLTLMSVLFRFEWQKREEEEEEAQRRRKTEALIASHDRRTQAFRMQLDREQLFRELKKQSII